MSKQSNLNNHANQLNANKGTSGFNIAYLAAMKNHGNQLNPTSPKFNGGKGKK